MKTTIIIFVFLLIGLFNETSVTYKTEFVSYKLKETPVLSTTSKRLETQLSILQKNMMKYDKILKRKMLKNSNIIVVPDTSNIK